MTRPDKASEAGSARVLVVDDDPYLRENLRGILRDAGYDTEEAPDGQQALEVLAARPVDLTLLDLKLERSRVSGMDVLRHLAGNGMDVPVVIVSGEGTIRTAVEATRLGAYDFLEKPVSQERILLTVRNALDKVQLQRERDRLLDEVSQAYRMIGSSPAVREIYALIDRAAQTGSKVLITGESGSGKELVAHAIHQKSDRSGAPFVVVNSAAVPEDLIESELFGYEKGAFTGASRAHAGKFAQADGGTLFLDEIGDMSLPTQAKILRVLEAGRITPLGGRAPQEVDVRLIAATNKDLTAEVHTGRFRRDLYYRLNVIHIRVPPLRQRREDIPALIDYFLLYFWKEEGLPLKEVTTSA
ncbi:MAG: response regulator, partial [Bacteroidetes bacterium]|nr:response regulator [Bacteroidota bacterium]